jgi:hypothetical protein
MKLGVEGKEEDGENADDDALMDTPPPHLFSMTPPMGLYDYI